AGDGAGGGGPGGTCAHRRVRLRSGIGLVPQPAGGSPGAGDLGRETIRGPGLDPVRDRGVGGVQAIPSRPSPGGSSARFGVGGVDPRRPRGSGGGDARGEAGSRAAGSLLASQVWLFPTAPPTFDPTPSPGPPTRCAGRWP